jgi:hypothetical protein
MTLDLEERNYPPHTPNSYTCESEPEDNRILKPSLSAASGADKKLLVFVGLCSFVFVQPTALQPRDPSFVSKKEDGRC